MENVFNLAYSFKGVNPLLAVTKAEASWWKSVMGQAVHLCYLGSIGQEGIPVRDIPSKNTPPEAHIQLDPPPHGTLSWEHG